MNLSRCHLLSLNLVNNMHCVDTRHLLRILENGEGAELKHDGGDASDKVHLVGIRLVSQRATDCT